MSGAIKKDIFYSSDEKTGMWIGLYEFEGILSKYNPNKVSHDNLIFNYICFNCA